jgi:AcrR family transcriptional regulator
MVKREDRIKQITEKRREQILNAALNIISRYGFDRATIPDVAREAGISVGTIYNYYESKRDLLLAIADKFVIEPFADFIKRGSTEGDTAFITAIMENRLNFGLDNVGKFLPIFNEVQKDEELRRNYYEKVLKPVMAMMENFVTSRMEQGAFREINPHLLTRAVGGMVIGFMILYRLEGEESPLHKMDRQKMAAELAGLIFQGLRKQ